MRVMPAALSAAAHSSNRAAGAVVAAVDGRIAAAADDQVAFEDAVLDLGVGFERRLEAIVPAERFRRGRQRDDLHVRRRHHQLPRVQRVEHPAGVERLDLDAPEPLLHDGRVEDPVEIGGERAFGAGLGFGAVVGGACAAACATRGLLRTRPRLRTKVTKTRRPRTDLRDLRGLRDAAVGRDSQVTSARRSP